MNKVVEENPFSVEHCNLSWKEIRKYTGTLIKNFPPKYKLAYFNDYHEKIIILINDDHNFFGIQDPQILIISKIDNDKKQSLLSFEIKHYRGAFFLKEEYDKGESSIRKIVAYLKTSDNRENS